jgi:hypothetical protein
MIQKFVERFIANKEAIETELREGHPESYSDLVVLLVDYITSDDGDSYDEPDPNRVYVVDDGDCQGMQLYVIGATGYQPSIYWATFVHYGSCSGCDTLEAISDYSTDPPTEEQVEGYMTLMLHLVQKLRCITSDNFDFN